MPLTFAEILAEQPVMVILRGLTAQRTVEMATKAWDLGIRCIEVPVQDATAIEALRAAVDAARGRPVWVGAGTVTSTARLRAAAHAGARFTVAPGFNPDVATQSIHIGLPHLPGVATATEVQRALASGFDWLKAFPARALTTEWFRAMRGPFPETALVATGGIDADNAQSFLQAGCRALAVGSALASPSALSALVTVLNGQSAPSAPPVP